MGLKGEGSCFPPVYGCANITLLFSYFSSLRLTSDTYPITCSIYIFFIPCESVISVSLNMKGFCIVPETNSLGSQRSIRSHFGEALHCNVRKIFSSERFCFCYIHWGGIKDSQSAELIFKKVKWSPYGYFIRHFQVYFTESDSISEPAAKLKSLSLSARALKKQESLLGMDRQQLIFCH